MKFSGHIIDASHSGPLLRINLITLIGVQHKKRGQDSHENAGICIAAAHSRWGYKATNDPETDSHE